MQYEFHLIKSNGWSDIASDPITGEDIDALLASDPELSWTPGELYDTRDELGRPARCFVLRWREQPCFEYVAGEIRYAGTELRKIAKLVELGKHIDGRVIGDDGERYRRRRILLWETPLIGVEAVA
jgi:hypothetical protein